MVLTYDSHDGPVMTAAKMALVTGNANYVLIWIPEESENTLKNLLEKTCCERRSKKNMQSDATEWYFDTIYRLSDVGGLSQFPGKNSKGFDENPVVRIVQRAVESGDVKELSGMIPQTRVHDCMERFHYLMDKRNYDLHDIATGRAYISAFRDFAVLVYTLSSDS